jgi:predicted dithiol-disulfide oxidoreductase (DUF899 family)
MRDQLSAERQELPWVRVGKQYIFDGPEGKVTLAALFDGRSQLIVKHFMFGPDWEEGCPGCSFGADHIEGALVHLEHHDVSFTAVSRAPLPKIEAFKKRMGWRFNWVSSFNSDFNYDMHVSFTKDEIAKGEAFHNFALRKVDGDEASGVSVFYMDESGDIFHTYSAFGRGDEELVGAYMFLDLTPKGRNESGPNNDMRDWVRHHDKYVDSPKAASCCCS